MEVQAPHVVSTDWWGSEAGTGGGLITGQQGWNSQLPIWPSLNQPQQQFWSIASWGHKSSSLPGFSQHEWVWETILYVALLPISWWVSYRVVFVRDFVVNASWHFWVVSFFNSMSGIYGAKKKTWEKLPPCPKAVSFLLSAFQNLFVFLLYLYSRDTGFFGTETLVCSFVYLSFFFSKISVSIHQLFASFLVYLWIYC